MLEDAVLHATLFVAEHAKGLVLTAGLATGLALMLRLFTQQDQSTSKLQKPHNSGSSTAEAATAGAATGAAAARAPAAAASPATGLRPRWELFTILNYVVLIVFVVSIGATVMVYRRAHTGGASSGSVGSGAGVGSAVGIGAGVGVSAGVGGWGNSSMLFPLLLLWCGCLAYFMGFFGISLAGQAALDPALAQRELQDRLEELTQVSEQPVQAPTPQTQAQARARAVSLQQQAREQQQESKAEPRKSSLKPMHDTPICAERPKLATVTATAAAAPAAASGEEDASSLSDEQVLAQLQDGTIKDHQLEKKLGDYERAVRVRRQLYEATLGQSLSTIPFEGYQYDKVFGANCEIVIGYVPLPLGVVGPLLLNGESVFVPMATTEGCLVASTNRGCKAISQSGGAHAVVVRDGITRAPCLRLPSAMRAAEVKMWIERPENFALVEAAFNSTTNYGHLKSVAATVAGRNVFLRFVCFSGDAMGMNMVSKGCLKAMDVVQEQFPDMQLVALSGNMCTDKKPAAINWIEGRGKSVVVEATIPAAIVEGTLKTTVRAIVETNRQKNLIGSAMAASVGGFNAHASNIVTAVFLATGQDPAQNVESSNCITLMEFADDNESLHVSCTMPSIEVGTVGGGTHLPAQAGCLDIVGARGASREPLQPGDNSRRLARIVAAAVMAGELSLMAALAANHLVKAHMQHNRKPQTPAAAPAAAAPAAAANAPTPVAEAAPSSV